MKGGDCRHKWSWWRFCWGLPCSTGPSLTRQLLSPNLHSWNVWEIIFSGSWKKPRDDGAVRQLGGRSLHQGFDVQPKIKRTYIFYILYYDPKQSVFWWLVNPCLSSEVAAPCQRPATSKPELQVHSPLPWGGTSRTIFSDENHLPLPQQIYMLRCWPVQSYKLLWLKTTKLYFCEDKISFLIGNINHLFLETWK